MYTSLKHRLFVLYICLLCLICNQSNAQDFAWAKGMGNADVSSGRSIVTDASGNIYIIGNFENTVDFDPSVGIFNLTSVGSSDIFVSKFDALGNFIWVKAIGGTSVDSGNDIAVDMMGNICITGVFRRTVDFDPGVGIFNLSSAAGDDDIFVSKLDALGNFIWAKRIGGTSSDNATSIAIDALNNIYTTGDFSGTVDFDPSLTNTFNLISSGSDDIFISKLDASGNFVWAKRIGGTSNNSAFAITLDASNNVYTTGYFRDTADFNPGVGVFNLTSIANSYDIFVSKLDVSGNFVWAKSMGGINLESGFGITTDALGNVYTTGYFADIVDFDPNTGVFNLVPTGGIANDIFVSKLDASGNFVWAKNMGGVNNDHGQSIVVDVYNNVYITGAFRATADFDPNAGVFNLTSPNWHDVFISKLDVLGNFVWAKNMGGTGGQGGWGIALDASNNVYTTGQFGGTLGIFNIVSASLINIFISKLLQPLPPLSSILTLSTNAISDFTTTPLLASTAQTFTITGLGLTANASISLGNTDYELSTDNVSFNGTINLPQLNGNLIGQPVTIYVRLKSGLSAGNKTATLTASSAGANSPTLTLNGTVIDNTPSPIITLQLEGKRQTKENVLLNWNISKEINNQGFEVQMGENEQSFQKVAFVDGLGNSNTPRNYELPLISNKDAYYRLKQISTNGQFMYSNVVFIPAWSDEIIIFPNPAQDYINIQAIPNTTFEIIDAKGAFLQKGIIKDYNTTIYFPDFSKGLYLVIFRENDKRFVKKLMLR